MRAWVPEPLRLGKRHARCKPRRTRRLYNVGPLQESRSSMSEPDFNAALEAWQAGDRARAIRMWERLADAGLVLINQTVLLRGVNDDHEVLERLCWRLAEARVSDRSKPTSVAVTVMMTKGVPSAACARITPISVPCRPTRE